MRTNRRNFLRGVVMSAGLLGEASCSIWRHKPLPIPLPPAGAAGIEHIVIVTMENRSFDHFLGWLPNADGKQAGLTYQDLHGQTRATHRLAPDFTGCPNAVDNSYQIGRVEWDHGAMDGWLKTSANSLLAIGYYTEADQPFLSALARNYTTLDHHFCAILSSTFPNRLFLYAAQTDRLDDTVSLVDLPTILDHLASAGVSARYYFSNLPFLALWGLKYLLIARTYGEFLEDAASGHLPAVSFVDPAFTVIDNGTGTDDHPHSDIRRGDAFLARTFHALASSPAWQKTILIVIFDEWGGFFDHVAPPRAVASNRVDSDLVDGKA
ncbi:MAG: alkaline phosphatase family protein, partial [Terriglobia bacterium]